MTVYSSRDELIKIRNILASYAKFPYSEGIIPGAVLEAVLAHVKGAKVLHTYDFVDVVDLKNKRGWQVKSTKASTPVTWKRAKIPNAEELIEASRKSEEGLQELGDAILNFCNKHIWDSMTKFGLDNIGYSRLLIEDDGTVKYFERLLCTSENPIIFDPQKFKWNWSTAKQVVKKEQLQALHGIFIEDGRKWWTWHGLGENQLHFSGESTWWPAPDDPHLITFKMPSQDQKVSLESLMKLLDHLDM